MPTDDEFPTTIKEAETALCTRLRAKIAGIAVEPFPDDVDDYQLKHQVGALLVGYAGAKYGPVVDTEATVQERRMRFQVHVLARSLSKHDSAIGYLEAVRLTLAGYRVPGFGKAVPRGEQLLGKKGDVWMYAIEFDMTTMAVELPDDPATLPALLQRLDLLGSAGNLTITSQSP